MWDCTLIKAMKQHGDTVVNPIYDWLDRDVWDYIKQEGIKVNPLYEQGYKRIGCIGCPLSSYREKMKDFERYPAYKLNYKRAFGRLLDKLTEDREWNSPDDVFDWWIEKYSHEIKGQMNIFDYLKEDT